VQGQFTARGGVIDFDGFCQLMGKKMKDVDSEMELRDAFRVLDNDGLGYITCKEMTTICKVLGEDLDEIEVHPRPPDRAKHPPSLSTRRPLTRARASIRRAHAQVAEPTHAQRNTT